MVNIFVNQLPYYFIKSTDFSYTYNLALLGNCLDAKFYFPRSYIWGLKENFFALFNKACSLLHIPYRKAYRYPKEELGKEFDSYKFDVVYSQAFCPRNTNGVPVFVETGFWKPGQNRSLNEDDIDKFRTFTIPYFEDLLKLPCLINLKSNQEIKNVEDVFPMYRGRFVCLPFLLPQLNHISRRECQEKHLGNKKLKILFVGGEAIRKGLPDLIRAYVNLCNKFPKIDTEFHIVSNYNDGHVELPKGYPIIEHGKLSFEETQRLMTECQIFAMVSKRESYGWVYLEALSKGCVTIVRDYFPQKEFIDNGDCGLLACPEDLQSITDALIKACQMTDEQRFKMGMKAVDKFYRTYHINNVLPKYKYVFNNIKSIINGN